MSEAEAWHYTDLMVIVEEKVKPQRISLLPKNNWNRTVAAKWWLFGAHRKELAEAIAQCVDAASPQENLVLVISCVGQHGSSTFLPSRMVYSESLVIFPVSTHTAFCTF